jgi:membrane-bound serine protease (ClpP class)
MKRALLLLIASLLWALSAAAEPAAPVLWIEIDTIIHPVAAEFLADGIEEAERIGAAALVVKLSTPGGLLTSTREMTTAMLETKIPVVIYVAPNGAQAASAGFFLLMGADFAAMAPGTNTGAAHPVGGQGEDIEGTMGEKVEQDAAATIRSLAQRRGRPVDLAEAAVIESRSFTAEEALEAELIDFIAEDIRILLQELDGRRIEKKGEEVVLEVAEAELRSFEMNSFQEIRSVLVHPNIAYLLLTLGGLGLYFELSNPGAILPGVVGAIFLVLGLYAMSVLPVSYAGVALLILAAFFFLAEIKVTSYGLLALAGVVCLVLGSLMLFDSPDPAVRVSLEVIISLTIFTVAVVGSLMVMIMRVHSLQVRTGLEGLLNERGIAHSPLDPDGKVFVHGEYWHADSDLPIEKGGAVEVMAVEQGRLKVRSVDT